MIRRVFTFYCLLCLSVPLALSQQNSQAQPVAESEVVYWKDAPIKVVLPVGKEKPIKLPFSANLHMPQALIPVLGFTNLNGVIVFQAKQSFKPVRIKLVNRNPQAGEASLFLLDITALDSDVPVRPLEIRVPGQMVAQAQGQAPSSGPANTTRPIEHPYSVLSRFVYQRLYAPERLWETFSGVQSVQTLKGYYPLYEGGAFATHVLGTWRFRDYYATAIRVENRTNSVREIDPRAFRGDFKARSGHIYSLMPHGTGKDMTAFVLISDRPLEQAVPDYVLAGSR